MRIGFLGAGSWGFCLASLLSNKGYSVTSWTTKAELAERLNKTKEHPLFPNISFKGNLKFTTNLKEAVENQDFIIESVTSAGIRPVFEQIKKFGIPLPPVVLTSKGIEQNSGLILSDVIIEILGEGMRSKVASLSGPSYAQEVIKNLPASVVGSAYDENVMKSICDLFTTPTFRVYPNGDMRGVAFGGALKNIIAIACGISDGLNLGHSSKAALITRGLHEMRKLAVAEGAKAETLSGLSGLGDLCMTCSSVMSRNFRFGYLLAQGESKEEALKDIDMVVEGAYTCISALQLSQRLQIPMPITESVYSIIYDSMKPSEAVQQLMKRAIKEEHL